MDAHVFWYRIIARPLAWCYLKIAFDHRVVGRDKLKKLGGDGFFLYGNHTNPVADAFIPSMVAYPRDVYVIVHACTWKNNTAPRGFTFA